MISRNFGAALVAATLGLGLSTPTLAAPPAHAPAHGKRAKDAGIHPGSKWDPVANYRRGDYRPRTLSRDDVIYRGSDGRYYCERDDGTAGLIIGGIVGGTLGNVIAPEGSKTLGTILGGAAGAVIGKSIDDDGVTCR